MSSSTSSFRGQAGAAVLRLLAFFLFLFLFDRLLFLAIRGVEERFYKGVSANGLEEKFAAVRDKDQYEVLILGTSRTFDGVHPCYIEKDLGVKSFKEAFVGKGPMYNYFFYQQYKKHLGVPRVIIYGVDYFLFNVTSDRQWMKRFPADIADARYFRGGPLLLLANKPRIDEFCNAFLNRFKADVANDSNYLLERNPARMETYRGVVSPGTIDASEPTRFRRVRFFPFPGKEGEFFLRLLKEAQRDKVQVLLVALPEFIGTYRTNYNHRRFHRVFRYFSRALDNVFFYNYDLPERFDLSRLDFFIDGGYGKTNSHLSSVGAERFHRLLIRDLARHLGKA
ncbi:MAG: hypothetical protein JXO51_08315 [Candidatus Aminicenantes bacterium]|nr:hypothetical protein [Candidatus Aminicenantes bacterium]